MNNDFLTIYLKGVEDGKDKKKQEIDMLERKLYDLQQKIDKALDMLDLIIPELWNISNAMTYKIKEVRKILGDKE